MTDTYSVKAPQHDNNFGLLNFGMIKKVSKEVNNAVKLMAA
jgi:hypothetical protein